MERKIEDKRLKGRSLISWTNRLEEMTGQTIHKAIHFSQDRGDRRTESTPKHNPSRGWKDWEEEEAAR